MWPCIVIHKNKVWTNGISEQTHMGKKYLLTIAIPSYRPSVENVELSSPVQHNASPGKDSRTTVTVSFLDVTGLYIGHPPAVVVRERPPPIFLTAVPVVWNAFKACETTLLLIPNSAATLVTLSSDLFSFWFGNSSKRSPRARRRFVEWTRNEIAVVPDFHKRILFSDEAHFWLNGYVNKQNCRIWSEANPQVYVETPLHPEKLTVWCALWAGGIIGPYFFKNDEGHNVTVNGDRYRAMITNFFIPELNNHDVQELWFQQDGATCHTVRATIDLLKDTFGDRLILRFGPVNWPPRSCDLTLTRLFSVGLCKVIGLCG
ncbi:uncharacterized protein TNCV_2709321 [Trichonephila clavipes]|nr:uncharacterized protein TNCV_2709321 [Trichonephila clavipes]